jgi:hypothetical protein
VLLTDLINNKKHILLNLLYVNLHSNLTFTNLNGMGHISIITNLGRSIKPSFGNSRCMTPLWGLYWMTRVEGRNTEIVSHFILVQCLFHNVRYRFFQLHILPTCNDYKPQKQQPASKDGRTPTASRQASRHDTKDAVLLHSWFTLESAHRSSTCLRLITSSLVDDMTSCQ